MQEQNIRIVLLVECLQTLTQVSNRRAFRLTRQNPSLSVQLRLLLTKAEGATITQLIPFCHRAYHKTRNLSQQASWKLLTSEKPGLVKSSLPILPIFPPKVAAPSVTFQDFWGRADFLVPLGERERLMPID